MKLRIRDNSIRLRLSRGEVSELCAEHVVRAAVSFPEGDSLEYVCEAVSRLASPSAAFDGKAIIVSLPLAEVQGWAGSDQVSIRADVVLDDGTLAILVEKDFACLAPRAGEDESDLYAHPEAGRKKC